MSNMPFVKIDSHAHLTSDELYLNLSAIIKRAQNQRVVAVININTDIVTLERGLETSEKYREYFFNTGATTPHDVEKDGALHFDAFKKAAKEGKLVALGESGLDYHYEHSNKEIQKQFLLKYLDLARETNLPLVIHCRGDDAFTDLFLLTEDYKDVPCLLHCFTGNESQAKEAIKRGWYISISGIATFKKSSDLRRVIENIPLERILIETDSPYLAPQSKRGTVNEPANVGEVLQTIVEVQKTEIEEASFQIAKNTCAFFRLSSSILEKP